MNTTELVNLLRHAAAVCGNNDRTTIEDALLIYAKEVEAKAALESKLQSLLFTVEQYVNNDCNCNFAVENAFYEYEVERMKLAGVK